MRGRAVARALGNASSAVLALVALAFLYGPLVVLVLFSFHATSGLNLPFSGFSLDWFEFVFTDPEFTAALTNSAFVGVVTALATGVLGVLAALGLTSAPPRMRGVLAVLFFAPITLPPLFIGLSLLTVYSQLDVPLSLYTVVIGHVVFSFPYFLLIARAAVERLDPAYTETAADLGATPLQRFRQVTLPQVWPSLAAATLLAFAISFDEFIITFFVIGPDSTVPMVLWSSMRRTADPSINAIAAVLLAITLLGAILTWLAVVGRARGRALVRR